MSEVSKSPKGQLSHHDWKKILRHLGIGALGALGAYLLQATQTLQIGPYTPVVVALLASGAHALIKLAEGPKQ